MKNSCCLTLAVYLATTCIAWAEPIDVEPLLQSLRAVGPKGAGHREAMKAWERLARADAGQLPSILAGIDTAGPLAANWIRTAVDTIAESQLRSGGQLPADGLEQFVRDTSHAPRPRRLAYEWLLRVDEAAKGRLLPEMLDDPSIELRRDAIAGLIDEAAGLKDAGKTDEAVAAYARALAASRDLDQVKLLAERLRKLGRKVDLPRHFGFLVRWQLIGPLDNTDEKGFDVVYPPEHQIDLAASCEGKHGEVKWIEQISSDDYGLIDFHKTFKEEKEVVGYATTEFISPRQQEVQIRVTSFNAVKLWVNGTQVDQHKVYHGGSQMDQYACSCVLRPGRNVFLIKVCQNAQTQSWANHWDFKLRVCDPTGGAVLSTDRDKAK